jgi:RNA polymerase sigma-70 factor (ECF subfamily)
VRPDLHRYCARMTGSVSDGEDVVQETLARAYYQLPELTEMPPLRPWLFRIAHNRAIDHLRRGAYRATEALEAADGIADDRAREPESALVRSQAVEAALASFLVLAPAQRACVVLKDVLDHTHEEIGALLDLSVPAVKSALHRGRALLAGQAATAHPAAVRPVSAALARYARLFNAHDFDGVRALLADDVRLDLVSRRKADGRRAVGSYFANYGRHDDWRATPAWLEGREVLAIASSGAAARPDYFIELAWRGQQVCAIRDFRYVPYIVREATLLRAP